MLLFAVALDLLVSMWFVVDSRCPVLFFAVVVVRLVLVVRCFWCVDCCVMVVAAVGVVVCRCCCWSC